MWWWCGRVIRRSGEWWCGVAVWWGSSCFFSADVYESAIAAGEGHGGGRLARRHGSRHTRPAACGSLRRVHEDLTLIDITAPSRVGIAAQRAGAAASAAEGVKRRKCAAHIPPTDVLLPAVLCQTGEWGESLRKLFVLLGRFLPYTMDPSEVGYRLRFLRRFLNAAVARGTAEHVISCIRYQSGYRRFDNNFLNPPGTAATEAR